MASKEIVVLDARTRAYKGLARLSPLGRLAGQRSASDLMLGAPAPEGPRILVEGEPGGLQPFYRFVQNEAGELVLRFYARATPYRRVLLYSTVPGGALTGVDPAVPGLDYESADGSVVWEPGESDWRDVPVELLSRGSAAPPRQLTVSLTFEETATGFKSEAAGTILIRDAAQGGLGGEISFQAAEMTCDYLFVERTGGSSGPASVQVWQNTEEILGTLSWADGEYGGKMIDACPYIDQHGTAIMTLQGVTGAVLGAIQSATITAAGGVGASPDEVQCDLSALSSLPIAAGSWTTVSDVPVYELSPTVQCQRLVIGADKIAEIVSAGSMQVICGPMDANQDVLIALAFTSDVDATFGVEAFHALRHSESSYADVTLVAGVEQLIVIRYALDAEFDPEGGWASSVFLSIGGTSEKVFGANTVEFQIAAGVDFVGSVPDMEDATDYGQTPFDLSTAEFFGDGYLTPEEVLDITQDTEGTAVFSQNSFTEGPISGNQNFLAFGVKAPVVVDQDARYFELKMSFPDPLNRPSNSSLSGGSQSRFGSLHSSSANSFLVLTALEFNEDDRTLTIAINSNDLYTAELGFPEILIVSNAGALTNAGCYYHPANGVKFFVQNSAIGGKWVAYDSVDHAVVLVDDLESADWFQGFLPQISYKSVIFNPENMPPCVIPPETPDPDDLVFKGYAQAFGPLSGVFQVVDGQNFAYEGTGFPAGATDHYPFLWPDSYARTLVVSPGAVVNLTPRLFEPEKYYEFRIPRPVGEGAPHTSRLSIYGDEAQVTADFNKSEIGFSLSVAIGHPSVSGVVVVQNSFLDQEFLVVGLYTYANGDVKLCAPNLDASNPTALGWIVADGEGGFQNTASFADATVFPAFLSATA